jgi:uncharacterized membrane protein
VVGAASALFIAVFLACVVEAVEATTIVLAAGTARDWRSAGLGVGAALAALAVIVAALGPAVSEVPLRGLRVVVGALLLIFGLQWIRKAVLRASGHKALHDEEVLYAKHLADAAGQQGRRTAFVPDWYGFTLSFKGVLLEGLEVVFIVLTFGSNDHNVGLAAIAAGCAVVLVAIAGLAVRAPLARVPENTMKFVVGIMLTSFGLSGARKGRVPAGPARTLPCWSSSRRLPCTRWPWSRCCGGRGQRAPVPARQPGYRPARAGRRTDMAGGGRSPAARLRAFGAFWYDFVIGDDWLVAAAVVIGLAGTYGLSRAGVSAWWLIPAVLVVLLPVSLSRAASGSLLPRRTRARRRSPAAPRTPPRS